MKQQCMQRMSGNHAKLGNISNTSGPFSCVLCPSSKRERLKINMFKIPEWNYNEFTGCKETMYGINA